MREGKDVPLKCNRGTLTLTQRHSTKSLLYSIVFLLLYLQLFLLFVVVIIIIVIRQQQQHFYIALFIILHRRRRRCCYLAWAAISFVRCLRHIAIQKHYARANDCVCVCERAFVPRIQKVLAVDSTTTDFNVSLSYKIVGNREQTNERTNEWARARPLTQNVWKIYKCCCILTWVVFSVVVASFWNELEFEFAERDGFWFYRFVCIAP